MDAQPADAGEGLERLEEEPAANGEQGAEPLASSPAYRGAPDDVRRALDHAAADGRVDVTHVGAVQKHLLSAMRARRGDASGLVELIKGRLPEAVRSAVLDAPMELVLAYYKRNGRLPDEAEVEADGGGDNDEDEPEPSEPAAPTAVAPPYAAGCERWVTPIDSVTELAGVSRKTAGGRYTYTVEAIKAAQQNLYELQREGERERAHDVVKLCAGALGEAFKRRLLPAPFLDVLQRAYAAYCVETDAPVPSDYPVGMLALLSDRLGVPPDEATRERRCYARAVLTNLTRGQVPCLSEEGELTDESYAFVKWIVLETVSLRLDTERWLQWLRTNFDEAALTTIFSDDAFKCDVTAALHAAVAASVEHRRRAQCVVDAQAPFSDVKRDAAAAGSVQSDDEVDEDEEATAEAQEETELAANDAAEAQEDGGRPAPADWFGRLTPAWYKHYVGGELAAGAAPSGVLYAPAVRPHVEGVRQESGPDHGTGRRRGAWMQRGAEAANSRYGPPVGPYRGSARPYYGGGGGPARKRGRW